MRILDNFFNVYSQNSSTNKDDLDKIAIFEKQIKNLLELDKYLSQKDYIGLINDYQQLNNKLNILKSTRTLKKYSNYNYFKLKRIQQFLCTYADLMLKEKSSIIETHNKKFIQFHLNSDKEYLDNILKKVDSSIMLDEEQRNVILSDEDYTLVVAGAGAGKTTTIAAKVKYLVEKQGINPKEILVISYTNKAVDELKAKINKSLSIQCPITTFHKTGYAILRKQYEERKKIVDGGFLHDTINTYLKENILDKPELVENLILFFGSYFDSPYDGNDLKAFFNYITKTDFSTFRGNIKEYTEKIIDYRTGKKISISHETLKSSQEVLIANYLFTHNIEYVYEKPFPYNIMQSYKPYTPDFTITQGNKIAYIEHFGISEDGNNNLYTQKQLNQYKKAINHKIELHKKHQTTLIYTFSKYKDKRPLLVHLKEQLENHGFNLTQKSPNEIFEKIVNTEENKYIQRLVKLVCTFIQNFKVNGYTDDDFYKFKSTSNNERTKLFLQICEKCYHEYEKQLSEQNAIDFEDMINDSARLIKDAKLTDKQINLKYIIVDEYQDISRQRFNLTKELSNLCDAKIIAVGDDWQSIFAYAGSDISLFTKFKEIFGYGLELSITNTYRNAQELINIAGGFIQKNQNQIRKTLISSKHLIDPVIIHTYTEEVDRNKYQGRGGSYYLLGETVEKIIDDIYTINPHSNILLLGRYGFDGFNLCKSGIFVYDDKRGNVYSKKYNKKFDYLTAHRAKGLGYDDVIIINASNSVYGFPSQIEDDPVLKFVTNEDRAIDFAEERRLFYVALTRTKNHVYIVAPEQRPSKFVLELVNDFPNVKLIGRLNIDVHDNIERQKCPICGYPLLLRYKKFYGLKLWICSNELELCDFMTNNIKGGKLSILKCDACKDGYLIVKEGHGDCFLGCTNYKDDKTGCNKYITMKYYNHNILKQLQY